MRFFMVSVDREDMPDEPILAPDPAAAVDLFVQDILTRPDNGGLTKRSLRSASCIWISEFVAPEGGVGLMKDALSTSFPMRAIPSWQKHINPKPEPEPEPEQKTDDGLDGPG